MPGSTFIDGAEISLCTVESEDLEFLRENVNDPAMRSFTGHRIPDNLARIERQFEDHVDDDETVELLVCAEDERIGLVALSPKTATSRTMLGVSGCVEIVSGSRRPTRDAGTEPRRRR
jgi:hypothetical protein